MDNIFIFAAIISIIFLISKFIEMRVIDKESKPIKLFIRDSLIVYFSVVFGNFIIKQINPIIHSTHIITPVFTDNPGF
jgi:hypothetical protein